MAKNYSDKAYETLLERVISGGLRPSTPLDIHRIANELEMSVTPVRDAIKRLEADGLVEVIPRSGTFVRHFTIQDLIRGYELVEALEGMAGYLVAERVNAGIIDKAEIDALLSPLIDQMEERLSLEQVREWAELDGRFHQSIFDMSENSLISNSFSSARNQMKSVLSFVSPMYVDRSNSVREHRMIVAALMDGDCERARKVCQDHRGLVRQILKKLLPGS